MRDAGYRMRELSETPPTWWGTWSGAAWLAAADDLAPKAHLGGSIRGDEQTTAAMPSGQHSVPQGLECGDRAAAPNAFGALTASRCRTNPALQPIESAVAVPLPPLPSLPSPPKLWRVGCQRSPRRRSLFPVSGSM